METESKTTTLCDMYAAPTSCFPHRPSLLSEVTLIHLVGISLTIYVYSYI